MNRLIDAFDKLDNACNDLLVALLDRIRQTIFKTIKRVLDIKSPSHMWDSPPADSDEQEKR